jgi:hypothetical protein
MTERHPITPPSELVEGWILESDIPGEDMCEGIATRAAQWAADQELDACCEWVAVESIAAATELRAWRRPKPPSLKEQAMRVLVENGTNLDGRMELDSTDIETIRRALEALPE